MKSIIPLVALVTILTLGGCGDALVSTYTDASPQDAVDARVPRIPSVEELEEEARQRRDAACRGSGLGPAYPGPADCRFHYPSCPDGGLCRVRCLSITPDGGFIAPDSRVITLETCL